MPTNYLTVGIVTRDSERYLSRLLQQTRLYADYVIVHVDDRSFDGTLEIANKLADEVALVSVPDYIEPVLNNLHGACRTEWMLRLDDDELASDGFVEWHEALMQLSVSCVWLPRYNLIHDEQTYFVDLPYYPDHQPRLFRRGTLHSSRNLHGAPEINGKSLWMDRCHLFHMKLLVHSQAELDDCARRYEEISGCAPIGKYTFPTGVTEQCAELIA